MDTEILTNQLDARMLTPILRVSLSPKDIAMHVFLCDSDRTDDTLSFGLRVIKIRLEVFSDLQHCIRLAHSS